MSENNAELLTGHLPDYPPIYNAKRQNAGTYNKASLLKAKPKDSITKNDIEWLAILKNNSDKWAKESKSKQSVKVNADGSLEVNSENENKASSGGQYSGNGYGSVGMSDDVMIHSANAETKREIAKQEAMVSVKALDALEKVTIALLEDKKSKQNETNQLLLKSELQYDVIMRAKDSTVISQQQIIDRLQEQVMSLVSVMGRDIKEIDIIALAKFSKFKDILQELKDGKKIEDDPTMLQKALGIYEDLKPLLGDLAPVAVKAFSYISGLLGPEKTTNAIVVTK